MLLRVKKESRQKSCLSLGHTVPQFVLRTLIITRAIIAVPLKQLFLDMLISIPTRFFWITANFLVGAIAFTYFSSKLLVPVACAIIAINALLPTRPLVVSWYPL